MDSLYAKVYDYFLCNQYLPLSTTKLYKMVIEDNFTDNSKILDIGCGTCMTLFDNLEIIKQKKLQFTGVDIDKKYLQLAENNISKYNASQSINVKCIDFRQFNVNNYDYILFGEIYPVIDESLMTEFILHAKKIIKKNGKICFIHNLVHDYQKSHLIGLVKPYIN